MSTDTTCVFCDIVAGRAPGYIIHEDDLSLCLLDINPYTKGHCLVIPKRHVPWWHDLTEKETASLFAVARTVSQKIMEVYRPDFVSLFARGRRIPHTHIFLIPTFGDDMIDRFFNALEKFQESPPDLVRLRDNAVMEEVARALKIA
ncbi:MAG: HIT family protein [Desulfobacterota bacterium]|nr:HIT family protein [Thermodesulfobacteriota bacterium]